VLVSAHKHASTVGHPREPTAEQAAAAAEMLRLVADPTRLRLLWLLGQHELDVSSLTARAGVARPAVSQHLARLRLGGLVTVRRDGRRMVYRARGGHVRSLVAEVLAHADHLVAGHPEYE